MAGRLADRTCLVVGGTSGIGWAAALRFWEEGARVLVAGHPDHSGALARAGLSGGENLAEASLDAASAQHVAELFESAARLFAGRLDVLLCTVGGSGRRFGDGPLHDCTDDAWDRVMALNARAVFLTNRAAVQMMRGQKRDPDGARGAVINVGSVLDRAPEPSHFDTAAYTSAKGAVRALTLAAAARYATEGIRFNLIEPGLVDTPMAARAVEDASTRDFLRHKQPLIGGPLAAADVAEAAVFLASRGARGITGATITIDGGWCVSQGKSP